VLTAHCRVQLTFTRHAALASTLWTSPSLLAACRDIMSYEQIDFSLVRYSPIEGTHFFYDARYPSTVQFLLSGRWESWDVGWVR
jgi:hypothetical protein